MLSLKYTIFIKQKGQIWHLSIFEKDQIWHVAFRKPKATDLQQIGHNIRRIRTSQNISRAQLAFEISTSPKQLSRIETGEVNSGILTYIKISRALNVTITELLQKLKF